MRLRRSTPDKPGLTRKGHGRGFSYHDEQGQKITDADVVERIRTLAIPPAWKDVWICPYPNGHIQATGTDEAGRRQYLYHDDWRTSQDADKHDRVRRLARKLPAFREAVDKDLSGKGLGREKVLAVALRMLDYGVFRTGNTRYAEEYGSRGAATLLREDVTVRRGGTVVFDFVAKGGIERKLELEDDRLAAAVRSLKRARHDQDQLLVFRDRDGYHGIDASMVNERFHALVGDDYTVKDLRTWTATVVAAIELAGAEPPTTKKALNGAVKEMLDEVSDHLGNTPTVARASYVDPRVVDQYERGRTIPATVDDVEELDDPKTRAKVERSVNKLLDQDARE
ncbi:DNA topoisomerase IB [Kribbella sp. NPDC051770]|uniref:DNA topoisomerase IB n=1 Tax=Kribbella sp. NPDC051770 TaxID=3155413 RepID=UPI00341B0C26